MDEPSLKSTFATGANFFDAFNSTDVPQRSTSKDEFILPIFTSPVSILESPIYVTTGTEKLSTFEKPFCFL